MQLQDKNLKVLRDIPHPKYINTFDWSPSGALIASGDLDGVVRIYDAHKSDESKEDKEKLVLLNHARGIKALKFSPDSKCLATSGEDLHIHVCDVEKEARLHSFVSHADWITSIDFHPTTQNMFLTTSLDGTVKLWDRNVSKEVKTIDLGSGQSSA